MSNFNIINKLVFRKKYLVEIEFLEATYLLGAQKVKQCEKVENTVIITLENGGFLKIPFLDFENGEWKNNELHIRYFDPYGSRAHDKLTIYKNIPFEPLKENNKEELLKILSGIHGPNE